jgi:hypothetical protein
MSRRSSFLPSQDLGKSDVGVETQRKARMRDTSCSVGNRISRKSEGSLRTVIAIHMDVRADDGGQSTAEKSRS